jgi:hypothetical protein
MAAKHPPEVIINTTAVAKHPPEQNSRKVSTNEQKGVKASATLRPLKPGRCR